MLINVERRQDIAGVFHKRYFIPILQDLLYVLTSKVHKHAFKEHATILRKMLSAVNGGQVRRIGNDLPDAFLTPCFFCRVPLSFGLCPWSFPLSPFPFPLCPVSFCPLSIPTSPSPLASAHGATVGHFEGSVRHDQPTICAGFC